MHTSTRGALFSLSLSILLASLGTSIANVGLRGWRFRDGFDGSQLCERHLGRGFRR